MTTRVKVVTARRGHNLFPPYSIIDSKAKVKRHIDLLRKAELVGLDTEFDEKGVVCFGTSTGEDRFTTWGEYLMDYEEVFNDRKVKLVYHNFSADYFSMKQSGLRAPRHYADTMIMSWVLHTEDTWYHGLKDLLERYFRLSMAGYKEMFADIPEGKKRAITANMRELRETYPERLASYASLDPWATLRLCRRLLPQLQEAKARGDYPTLWDVYREVEKPFTEVLIRMRERGICIDMDELKDIQRKVVAERDKLLAKFKRLVGKKDINVNSGPQMVDLFFKKLGFPVIKTTPSGRPSLDAGVLHTLANTHGKRIAQLVLDYRSLDTHNKTFLQGIISGVREDSKGRSILHSDFNQVIDTGRISSRKFYDAKGNRVGTNLQNIPARESKDPHKIRRVFVPRRKGWVLVVADLAGIEVRVTSHEGNVTSMLEAFKGGWSPHSVTAKRIYGLKCKVSEVKAKYPDEYSDGKVMNFRIIYGGGAYGVGAAMGLPEREREKKGKVFLERFFREYPEIQDYMKRSIAFCKKNGYVRTIIGRRRYIPMIRASFDKVREHAERQAINTPIQGSAADIIKRAMVEAEFGVRGYAGKNVHRRLRKLKARLILQVHDELVYECPKENAAEVASIVERIMCDCFELKVPIEAEVGTGANWAEAK